MAQLSVTSNDPKIHFHFPKRNIGPLTSDIFKFTGKWHDYLSIHQTNIFFVNIYVAMFVHNVTLCFILTPERSFTMKANNIPNENLRCSADGQIRLSRKPVLSNVSNGKSRKMDKVCYENTSVLRPNDEFSVSSGWNFHFAFFTL